MLVDVRDWIITSSVSSALAFGPLSRRKKRPKERDRTERNEEQDRNREEQRSEDTALIFIISRSSHPLPPSVLPRGGREIVIIQRGVHDGGGHESTIGLAGVTNPAQAIAALKALLCSQ
jgi:hypothetical protein